MEKIIAVSLILGIMLMVGLVFADKEFNQKSENIDKYNSESASYTKYHGKGVYSTTHILRKKDFVKPDGVPKPDKGPKPEKTKGPACYKLMGVEWVNTPDYVAQDETLLGIATTSIGTWNDVTGFNLLGEGSIDGNDSMGDYPLTGVIAVCRTWWNEWGEIIEYDIMFDTDYTWGDATSNSDLMDLQNIATHEIGHAFGLLDVYQKQCSEVTMFGYGNSGDILKRDLAPQDITALQLIYGE
jgi:hypothetical protein